MISMPVPHLLPHVLEKAEGTPRVVPGAVDEPQASEEAECVPRVVQGPVDEPEAFEEAEGTTRVLQQAVDEPDEPLVLQGAEVVSVPMPVDGAGPVHRGTDLGTRNAPSTAGRSDDTTRRTAARWAGSAGKACEPTQTRPLVNTLYAGAWNNGASGDRGRSRAAKTYGACLSTNHRSRRGAAGLPRPA